MTPDCEDCGETFETFTERRLHDCSPSGGTDGDTLESDPAVQELDALVEAAQTGDGNALHRAMARYETLQRSAHDDVHTNRYRSVSRAYREPLVAALDEATREHGWAFLEDVIEAYNPETSDEFPHVTTIIQNVTGRNLIRTRVADGVDAIPGAAVEYFEAVLGDLRDTQDFIREGLHPFGWAIGHPDRDVAGVIHEHAEENIHLTNPLLEHAFYADQHAAVELLERIAADDAIQGTIPYRRGEISFLRYLLDAPAGVASDEFWPTIPRYWDWHEEVPIEAGLDESVERRVRELVTDHGLDADLPPEWTIADLTI